MSGNSVASEWQLWRRSGTIIEVTGFTPLVAQWYAANHPTQLKLYEYLEDLRRRIGPLPSTAGPLFLHFRVDVKEPGRLLKQYDLENFLTPLFGSRCLDPRPFVFVSAEKRVGGGSVLQIGRVEQAHERAVATGWSHFEWSAANFTKWKEDLRRELAAQVGELIAEGAVEMRLIWKCSPSRNWVNLWKATGDAMGPILGEYSHARNTSPKDDRIVSLEFHRNQGLTGHALRVGIWWRRFSGTDRLLSDEANGKGVKS